jgi:hypothetical protein
MSLPDLLASPATYLDGLDPRERLAQLRRLNRDQQRSLYQWAGTAPPLRLADLVPDAGPLVEVIHDGFNTLRVPGPLRRFQKRLCRPPAGGSILYGYNEGPLRRLIGPGYFVATETTGSGTADNPSWAERGGVVVDYFRLPTDEGTGEVAPGWPRVVPNDKGLQRNVYHQTRDFLRRVSAHVSIGAAYKNEDPLDHYFILCRA